MTSHCISLPEKAGPTTTATSSYDASPATFSPESPSPTSVPSRLTTYPEIGSNVQTLLASYQQTGTNDSVVTILEIFAKNLPYGGTQNISGGILTYNPSDELRKLLNHLLTAVLTPSEYPLYYIWVSLT